MLRKDESFRTGTLLRFARLVCLGCLLGMMPRLACGDDRHTETGAAENRAAENAPAAANVQAAIALVLPRIVRGNDSFPNYRRCFSCHHQGQSLMTLGVARQRGFEFDHAAIDRIVKVSLQSLIDEVSLERLREGRGRSTTTIGYLLTGLKAVDYPSDEVTTALVQFLLQRQQAEGEWRDGLQRPPAQGSSFSVTGLALEGLQHYADPASEDVRKSLELARQWLLATEPQDTEDSTFRLRGLVAAQASAEAISRQTTDLLKLQRPDGSWGQLPELAGDAYATGSVLVALQYAGLTPEHPAIARGMQFLLGTREADGYWLVETRARPVQVFFDNGDPGGKSQFISFAAMNWATLAFLQTLPPQPANGTTDAPASALSVMNSLP